MARWCSRHRTIVLVLWLVALAWSFGASRAAGTSFSTAATIMILVFASFALGPSIVIKQFGLGLAGAIIIDAFIIRTALVPALMHLTGKANWWLPRWLDHLIPHLNVEGANHPAPAPVRPLPAAATVPGSRAGHQGKPF